MTDRQVTNEREEFQSVVRDYVKTSRGGARVSNVDERCTKYFCVTNFVFFEV